MTEWRKFSSRAEFDAWHQAYKQANGYPIRGRNAASGKLAPLGTGTTTDYCAPVEIAADDVRAPIDARLVGAKPGIPASAPIAKLDAKGDVVVSDALVSDAPAEPVL